MFFSYHQPYATRQQDAMNDYLQRQMREQMAMAQVRATSQTHQTLVMVNGADGVHRWEKV